MRVIQKLVGCRYVRRPFFDFGERISHYTRHSTASEGIVPCYFVKLTKSDPNLRIIKVEREGIKTKDVKMALNKLSIDKVDLADKRVLMRYIL